MNKNELGEVLEDPEYNVAAPMCVWEAARKYHAIQSDLEALFDAREKATGGEWYILDGNIKWREIDEKYEGGYMVGHIGTSTHEKTFITEAANRITAMKEKIDE